MEIKFTKWVTGDALDGLYRDDDPSRLVYELGLTRIHFCEKFKEALEIPFEPNGINGIWIPAIRVSMIWHATGPEFQERRYRTEPGKTVQKKILFGLGGTREVQEHEIVEIPRVLIRGIARCMTANPGDAIPVMRALEKCRYFTEMVF